MGRSTTIPDQATAYAYARDEKKARRLTEVKFKHGHYDSGRIEIEQYNGYGERLYWVIAVETEDAEDAPVVTTTGGTAKDSSNDLLPP